MISVFGKPLEGAFDRVAISETSRFMRVSALTKETHGESVRTKNIRLVPGARLDSTRHAYAQRMASE